VQAAAIVVSGLRVVRGGARVLRDVSFSASAGMVTGLLGPSGSGKTTLMRAIVGVQRLAGGELRVLGVPAGAPELRRQVGYVTQAPAVYLDLTVHENLAYFSRVLDAPDGAVEEAIATVASPATKGRSSAPSREASRPASPSPRPS
jgi:ABC-2 type transport system ATP-binding protein